MGSWCNEDLGFFASEMEKNSNTGNEALLQRTYFASPLVFHYIKVPIPHLT